jgi:hypothetical protein
MTTPTTNIIVPLQGKVTTRSGAGGEMAAKTVQKGVSKQPQRSEEGERRRSTGPPWVTTSSEPMGSPSDDQDGAPSKDSLAKKQDPIMPTGHNKVRRRREETRDGGAVLAPSVTVA